MDNRKRDKSSLDTWVERIRDQEMPIFGHTVQSIINVAEDDEAPAATLARVVLQDASMTTRVLKLANTIYYNPRSQGINTISRAVVVLGFNAVRNMCLSISLVDSLVHGAARERLTHELARAIHAAVQSRALAIERGDESPEEVFIATLLYHLGEMAFWCFSGEEGDELDALMEQPGYTPEQAQDELLGFRFPQLTSNLVQEWRLNDLLLETLNHPRKQGVRGKTITYSHQLAEGAEQYGWSSNETSTVIKQMSELTGASEKELAKQLHQNARDAAQIASYYGASAAAQAIPIPGEQDSELPEELDVVHYPEPDGMLQLKILRELSQLLDKKSDFNLIMELVLEGIYRGVGCDRTLFALMTPDRKSLRGKFALGQESEPFAARFQFTVHPQQPNIFFHALESGNALWADAEHHPELKRFLSAAVTRTVGQKPFYVAPIVINDRGIGLIYADRALSDRPLDEEGFESFQHFAKQASMGLTLLTGKH